MTSTDNDAEDTEENESDASIVHRLLEAHGFGNSTDEFTFVVGWTFVKIDEDGFYLPTFNIRPEGHPMTGSWQMLVIVPAVADELGVEPTMLPQGPDRDAAFNWLTENPMLAAEIQHIATLVNEHGTVRESPMDTMMVVLDGGRAGLRQLA